DVELLLVVHVVAPGEDDLAARQDAVDAAVLSIDPVADDVRLEDVVIAEDIFLFGQRVVDAEHGRERLDIERDGFDRARETHGVAVELSLGAVVIDVEGGTRHLGGTIGARHAGADYVAAYLVHAVTLDVKVWSAKGPRAPRSGARCRRDGARLPVCRDRLKSS